MIVYILSEHLSEESSGALRREEIWGSNPYTPESDAVCVLQHSGLYDVKAEIGDDVLAIKLVLRIQPGETILPGSERHGLYSKSGASHIALSALQFELVTDPTQLPLIEALKSEMKVGPPRPHALPSIEIDEDINAAKMLIGEEEIHPNGENGAPAPAPASAAPSISTVPSIVPPPQKRVKRPRKSGIDLDPRVTIDVLPDTILQFNLSNELSFQYNLNLICDRGIEPAQWTSHRLHNAVLMLETGQMRYELSWESSPANTASSSSSSNAKGQQYDTYRFALVNNPTPKSRSWHTSHTVPLTADHAKPVQTQLDWSQIVWGPANVTILGTVYPVKRIFWIARTEGETAPNHAESADHPSA